MTPFSPLTLMPPANSQLLPAPDVNIGGSVGNGVTKKTDFLVVGSTDYCASVKGGKTGKLKKAEDLQKKGANLAIIDEGAFYDMLGE